MRPLRLAYLISRYPSISHTFILREVRGLRAQGFEIETASINAPDRPDAALTREEREERDRTFYVKRAGVVHVLRAHLAACAREPARYLRGLGHALRLAGTDLRALWRLVLYFGEAVVVGEWMRSRGLPHLHVHFAGPASTVGLLVTRTHGVTLSIMIHGPDEFYDVPGALLAEKMSGAAFVVCIGHYARSQMMRLSPPQDWEKLEVAPLGVDPERFEPAARRVGGDVFEVICVGRLVPAKGQHVLLRAIERLVGEGRKVRLRLVGDGPQRPQLEASVRERGLAAHVVFEGAVNQDHIAKLYAGADAFAIASFAEGIPVVLMEAMSMEIPCVTTWITGIPELIRDEVDGLLVAPSSAGDLARALARLMDEPDLRERIARQGRQRVLERYNLDPSLQRLAGIFRRHLTGRDGDGIAG